MDNLRLFPVSDVVMYKYYIGRLKMFEDKYEEARYDMTSIPSPRILTHENSKQF